MSSVTFGSLGSKQIMSDLEMRARLFPPAAEVSAQRPAGGCRLPGCAQNGTRNPGARRALGLPVLNEQSRLSCRSSSPRQQSLHSPPCQNALFPTGVSHPPAEGGAILQHASQELQGSGCVRRRMRFCPRSCKGAGASGGGRGFVVALRSTCGVD